MRYRLTYTLLLPDGTRQKEVSEFKTEALAREMETERQRLHLLYADVRLEKVEDSR